MVVVVVGVTQPVPVGPHEPGAPGEVGAEQVQGLPMFLAQLLAVRTQRLMIHHQVQPPVQARVVVGGGGGGGGGQFV